MKHLSYTSRSGRPIARAARQVSKVDTSPIERELCPARAVVGVVRHWINGTLTVRLACARGSHHEDIDRRDLHTPPTTAAGWNTRCPVGTWVVFRPREGEPIVSKTRSGAWTLGDGTAVVAIEGRRGGVALSLLEVVPSRVHCRMCGREGRA